MVEIALNVFKLKKMAALLFVGMFTTICFFVGITFYGLLVAIACLFAGLLVSVLVANILLKNPFTDMIEGKGILVVNLDSTGVLKFTIVGLQAPYVIGKMGKRNPIKDVWDRSTVSQFEPPKINKKKAIPKEGGGLKIELDEHDYNKNRFAMFHYPVLIWNDQIKSFITKDWLSEKEKGTFSEHGILYLNRRMEELNAAVKDFGRYVVESTKPAKSIFQSKWFWIIIIFFGVLLLALFVPAIIQGISNFYGGGSPIGNIANPAAVITPR